MSAELNIAEILYDTGELKFRYARVVNEDGSRWIRNGLFCEYHQNGQVISEGIYVNGKEQGLWRDYYPDGKLATEGYYEHGVEVGEWKYWDDGGVQIQESYLASE